MTCSALSWDVGKREMDERPGRRREGGVCGVRERRYDS